MPCDRPFEILVNGRYVKVPCRRCLGCRAANRLAWSRRLRFEMRSCYERGLACSFVTLTYDDSHIGNGSVRKSDVQDFLKRLRWHVKHNGFSGKFRYFLASEYGDRTLRAHYHICLFGLESRFLSGFLRKAWKFGFVQVAPLTTSRINYVLKYLQKQYPDSDTRALYEASGFEAPFCLFSKGLSSDYYRSHAKDIQSFEGLRSDGRVVSLPYYWAKKFGLDNSALSEAIRRDEQKAATAAHMSVFDYNREQAYIREVTLGHRLVASGVPADIPTHLEGMLGSYD